MLPKLTVFFLTIGVWTCSAASAVQGNIQIRLDPAVGRLSDPIVLHIDLINTSDEGFRVIETNPDANYKIDCTDPSGTPVALTAYGKKLHDTIDIFMISARTVQPGEDLASQVDLHKLFDLKASVRYTVRVSRTLYPMSSTIGATISSYSLTFTLQ